mmetsp:Transcript_9239/g.23785  ORF Transcript_9239/g.23785 Transcript_9239/m.23785 type:complete len:421 (+) Transcript_9239:104-1366(+)|eukprot:jgi/Tetstr1/444267/TSEL_032159.t1
METARQSLPLLLLGGDGTVSRTSVLAACAQSLGTAAAMAGGGWAMSRLGLLSANTAKGLAKISMNLTIPCLLFSTVVDCSQLATSGASPCPPVHDKIQQGWPLLLLPLLNVAAGMLIGFLLTMLFRPPEDFRRAIIAAVAFGNSTGLPITLLSISYSSLGGHNVLGEDPLTFLSVYLLIYPLLTWSVGGALMGIGRAPRAQEPLPAPLSEPLLADEGDPEGGPPPAPRGRRACTAAVRGWAGRAAGAASAVLQPPVVASLAAIVVAASPLRGAFVPLPGSSGDGAPLQFLADAMQRLGAAAVPLNMLILGASLSRGTDWKTLPIGLNLSIAAGKMIAMPLVGMASAALLRRYLPGRPASFYLVVVMETCTPSANNLMVMAELGDQNKRALATSIFTQYLLSPLLLTGSTWLAITQALQEA